MFTLVYVSSVVPPLSPAQLADLLSITRQRNSEVGITGMLLYKDGNVMQVLEGEEAAVQKLYASIARDPRHRGLQTLLQGPQKERQFPEWSMGFRDLGAGDLHGTPGYNEFLNTPLTGQEFSADPTRCQRLLMSFKKNM
jgi:acylphosphatase